MIMDDATFTSETAAMNSGSRSLLEQMAIIRSMLPKESSAAADDDAAAAAHNRNHVEGRVKEGMRLINDQMTFVSTEFLLTVLLDVLLFRALDGLQERGVVVSSDDAASDQHQQLMDAAAAATKKKKKAAAKKKRNRRNKAAAKHKKTKLVSWMGGGSGIISLIMMVAFSSIMTLIFPLSLIHQSDGSREGAAPPALPPSASTVLPQKNFRSNDAAPSSPDINIISPLPLPAVVPLPVFLPTVVSNRRMKSDERVTSSTLSRARALALITSTPAPPSILSTAPSSSPTGCVDTPGWMDDNGNECDLYEDGGDPKCPASLVGKTGSARKHCCYCSGGINTCDDYRSKCQDYFSVLGINDGVMTSLCKEAESCSCPNAVDHYINPVMLGVGLNFNETEGLYNECKCNFWLPLCEDEGGEACDYAAEYCCGDYLHDGDLGGFFYLDSPQCYCDFFNFAQTEFGHALKSKALNPNESFPNRCGEFEELMNYFMDNLAGSNSAFKVDIRSFFEKPSLMKIYEKTNGQKWTNNAGWMDNTINHCQWYGISCDEEGYVTGIDLRDNNLAGQFPTYTKTGSTFFVTQTWMYVKTGLGNLLHLKRVDLANNKLTGTIDYRPLYNILSLTHFDVSGNQLGGEVDVLVTSSVTHADFSNNLFTSMYRFEKYKVSPLQTLRFCDVSNNLIEKDATDLLENIPPNIEQFSASNNKIHGELPALLNNLPKLSQFNMSSNALSGILPVFADSILSLQELDLSNQTNGITGPIPEDLWRFQSLKKLNLAGNKLKDTIPRSIGDMSVLEVLDLSNNLLESAIPPELGKLDGSLQFLGLSNNALSGVIPSQLGLLQDAFVLLQGNSFNDSSTAPLSLCTLRSVKEFDLADNVTLCPDERNALSEFYGSAKGAEWTNDTNWLDEYTSYCGWNGVVCDDAKEHVKELHLANNGLSGRLSVRIGNLTSIEVLDLSDNDIKGSIPKEIGQLSELTYLRLSYNAFTGTAPESLGGLTKLQLLHLQSNRITEMPNVPQLDESIHIESTFVTDCGVPSAFDEALECENCTMCCNANNDCFPQEETKVQKWKMNHGTFAAVLFACFIVLCCIIGLFLYHFDKRKKRGNSVRMSAERRLEEDDKYALSRIGKDSLYSFFVTDIPYGWLVAFATLGIQVAILVFFVMASEANLQDDRIDIQFTWQCPRDSDACRDTADLTDVGWVIFFLLMFAFLAKDGINGCRLLYHSSRYRHPLRLRIRYFIGGMCLCSITLFALYVSTVYNRAIATSNTDIIINSVAVLFVMEIDERVFSALEAGNEKWTSHAAESEDSSSDADTGNKSLTPEMKEEIAFQKEQIESQEKKLVLQEEQMKRQSEDIKMLREAVKQMQESQTASATSAITPQCASDESMSVHTVDWENICSDRDEGKRGTRNEMKMRMHSRKVRLRFRRDRLLKGNGGSLKCPVMQSRNRGVSSSSGYKSL